MASSRRSWLVAVLLIGPACSGGLSCGGCGGVLDPIPGGFPAEARFDRAAELRLSQAGLDFIGREFSDLAQAYLQMSCGAAEPVACPSEFVVNGQRSPTVCGASAECVDGTNQAQPVLGFEIEQAVQSGATVCRDDVADPAHRRCFAWLRLEGLGMRPVAPNGLEATVTAQIYTSVIPIRFDPLGMDCVVNLNSNASAPGQQDFVITAQLEPWVAPAGVDGGQLDIHVTDVTAMIPDDDISIMRDPVHGDALDVLSCGIANVGRIKAALVGRLVGSLGDIIDDQIGDVLAQACGAPGDDPCPRGTSCNADDRCEVDATGEIVPQRLGVDGRLDFRGLATGFGSPTAGAADLSALVGGTAGTDATGASIGLRSGLELATPDPQCAAPGMNPRLAPGAMPPVAFPADARVDLDFDGTPESTFMMALGVSQPILDQLVWSAAGAGLFCAGVSAYDTELVNTGALSILMPSLQQLTHNDRFSWAVWPARVAIRPTRAPALVIGEGKVSGQSPNLVLDSPLLTLRLPGLELSFDAVVEERWVHLMRVVADVDLPLGVFVEPGGELRLVVGDLANAITNVHVVDSKILAETTMELEQAVPTLLSLVLPRLTDALGAPIALPSGSDLGGFQPTVLGIRGVPRAGGGFSHVGVYLDLAFDPSLAPPLRAAVDTDARVQSFRVPSSADMSVTRPGGPVVPELQLVVDHRAPPGARIEVQLRVDGGAWSPFTENRELTLRRPEWLLQGRHQVEVRAREVGRADTLDPSPAVVPLVVDTEPPVVSARLSRERGGIVVDAHDVVSGDQLTYRVTVGGAARDVVLDEADLIRLSEVLENAQPIELTVSDEVGNDAHRVLSAGVAAAARASDGVAVGCSSIASSASSIAPVLAALGLVWMRRRRA